MSYLTGRSQYIRYNGVQSESPLVRYGVPQGSVLGPVLFILYSADVINIATKHGFFAHSYADDLQIYDHSSQTTCLNLVPRMSTCIKEISTWMASNRLKLNPSKTELIWLGSSRRLKHCPMNALNITGVFIKPSSHVRDLGVYVDCDLFLEALISPARAFITFVSYVSCAGVSPRTLLTRLSEHLFTIGLTIATEFWLACHRLRSTGFNPFSVQQLALCCSYQAGPVSRIWCGCSSTIFPFHKGFSSSCARRWCTGVFITRRRYTYKISACPSRLSRVVLTSDRLQPVTFASHLQKLWPSAGVDFLLPVLRLGTIYPLLWKTIL